MKIIIILCSLLLTLNAKNYTTNSEVSAFIETLVKEYKIEKNYLESLFSQVVVYKMPLRMFRKKKKKNATDATSNTLIKKHPHHGRWDRYSKLKLNPSRVKQGVAFIQKYKTVFDNVERIYGVPREYIAAIIGIETVYGGSTGTFKVFDNLVTLSFEKNRRNSFFKKQLKTLFYLEKHKQIDIRELKGSYAGAIGLCQFMPSNYEAYGIDYNNDGHIALQYPEDAIASVANYFYKNGWQRGKEVATRVRYEGNRFNRLDTGYTITYKKEALKGITLRKPWQYTGDIRLIKLDKKYYDELWFATKNFFVITRYNHSAYYAMAVHLLATKIKKRL